MGKFLAVFLVASGIFAGVGMYYTQVYAFYDPVAANNVDDVQLTSLSSGQPEAIVYENFKAIDADSSPLRYRACFQTPMSSAMMTETYVLYENAVPLNAPHWFDCFDSTAIGAALEDGTALAYMGTFNVIYGFDRVVAVFDDGRGFVWHQLNECGEEVFDGNPPPDGCPPPPQN